jgi:hypothetical protein
MDGIDAIRDAAARVAAKAIGRDNKQPHQFQGAMAATDFIAIVMSLPVDADGWTPLQDSLTGELTYVLGGDMLGSVPLGG